MKIFSYLSILLASAGMFLSGCTGKSSGSEAFPADTVSFKTVNLADSVSLSDAVNDISKIRAKVNISVPKHYPDTAAFAGFRKTFVKFLFGTDTVHGDSEKLAVRYLKSFFANFKSSDTLKIQGPDIKSEEEMPEEDVSGLVDAELNVYNVYNRNGIVSLCMEKVQQFENQEKSTEHYYLNYNLNRKEVIDVATLFGSDNYEDLCNLLRRKLLEQNSADSEEDLINSGYFNLDNLSATDNFKIAENGIIWCYQPLEIGCYSLGETEIFVSFDELHEYAANDSTTLLN